jgi:hypothetical protein
LQVEYQGGTVHRQQVEYSGWDETLAASLYTSVAAATDPAIYVTHFEYSIRRQALLDGVASVFGGELCRQLSPEHRALLERGEEQLPEDIALATRMCSVQRETLMR